ncbi:MAG: peptidylprolyl isomerase [Pseudomonadota bacterium]
MVPSARPQARLPGVLAALTLTLALAMALAPPGAAAQDTPFRAVAVVNDNVITGYDLDQRTRLLAVLGFTTASTQAMRNAALEQLIDDRLKLEAGERLGLRPSAEVEAAGMAELAGRLDARPEEFRALLQNQGITEQAVRDLVAAEVVWNEVVRTRFSSRVEPGEAEIDSEIALAGGLQRTEFRIQEIGLPLDGDGRTEAQTRALAEQLYNDLSTGGDFTAAAQRYSRAPSAARGGEVGWVTTQTLPGDLVEALSRLEAGQLTRPLPVPGGLSIVKVLDRRGGGGSGLDATDPELRARVRESIIRQQSARLADGLLQELRRDALIEVR